MTRSMEWPAQSRFFPLRHGRYDVAAGLAPLGADFGNGSSDQRVFLIDANYLRYRETKQKSRAENLQRYYPDPVALRPELESSVVRFIAETLARDYPSLFAFETQATGYSLRSHGTGEYFLFGEKGSLLSQTSSVSVPYRDSFDALASLVQEDLAIWTRESQGRREWLASVHLCFPNHWAAEDKVGRSFVDVHAPVAGFGKLAKASASIVEGMIAKGPFVRFAWGVATDTELNHHPRAAFQGRQFDPANPQLFLRIERQTLTGFAEQQGSLFTIRTFFLDCERDLDSTERLALAAAIETMTPESLAYKGLTNSKNAILKWLGSLL